MIISTAFLQLNTCQTTPLLESYSNNNNCCENTEAVNCDDDFLRFFSEQIDSAGEHLDPYLGGATRMEGDLETGACSHDGDLRLSLLYSNGQCGRAIGPVSWRGNPDGSISEPVLAAMAVIPVSLAVFAGKKSDPYLGGATRMAGYLATVLAALAVIPVSLAML